MKKLKLFFACLLMAVLSIGQVWGADPVTVKSTFTKATVPANDQVTDLEDVVTWDITTGEAVGSPTVGTGKYSGTESLLFGSSGSNYFKTYTLSTDYFKDYNVTSVKIYVRNNGSKKGTLTATQGSVNIGSVTHGANTSAWGDLTVNTNTGEGGTLSVSYSVAQASYLSYIEVTYEAGSTPPPSCTSEITITKADDPANGTFVIDNSGKVCIDEGNATVNVTATPNAGYHLATVTSTVGTVGDIDGNSCAITNIGASTTISVTFAENPKYTVSFNVGGSTASQADITEASAGAGITLPDGPIPTCTGWTFAGWKETSAVDVETTTAPTLLLAGANYKPAANCTLYAVYKRTESGAVTDQDITETFENQEAGSSYNSTINYEASASNANIAWTMYYGCVSTNVKLTGDKSAQMRWYKSATSNLGYIQSTTPINGLQSVSFNAKTDNANSSTVKISVWYSTDGDTWTKVKDNEAAPTATGAISATIDGTVGTDYYVRIGVGDEGTAPSSSSAKLTIDDVQFNFKAAAITTYYLSAPTCSCEQLGTPSVTVTNKTYNSAKLTWAAVDNADKYLVKFNGVDQEATENLYFDATGLEAEETYTYQVKALAEEGQDDYCDGDFSTEASFTTEEAPDATLTLSERGTTHAYSGSHKVGDVVALPAEAEECNKTFVGWSANASCAVAPEYAPGASYTLAAVSQTLYAVYATPSGTSTWEEIFAVPSAGDYAIYSDGHLMEAAISSNRFQNAAASVTDGKLDEAPAASCIWTVSINASDYFQFKNGTKYASSTNSNNQGALTEDATDTKAQWTIAYSEGFTIENVGRKAAAGNYTLRNNGDYGWGSYSASQGTAPRLFKKMTVYTGFSTSCEAALAKPTFSVDPEDGPFDHVLSVELAAAEGTIYYNINSVDDPTGESTEYTGAIDVDACGSTTIKAIAISSTNQSAVASATYVLDLDIPSVSAEDPYTEAEAVAVYNSGCYDNEDVWVTGMVQTAQFYTSSGTYTITLTNGYQFYKFYDLNGETFTEDYIEAGDVLVAKGKLSKHSTTYQLAEGCYLVSRTPASKEPIDSDIDNPLSVAAAINYIDNAATYDLSEDEYVAGIVESIAECPQHEGTYDIIVLDATDNTKQMKFFGCDVKTFAGIKQYDQITGKGKLDKYYSTYELNYPCEVAALTPYVAPVVDVTGVEVDETATIKVGKTVQLTANVLPANASNKNVTWSVKAGDESKASVSATGLVTGLAEGEATIIVTTEDGGFTDECVVTVNPISPWATVYTSNVAFVGGGESSESNSKVVINEVEYPAQKVGSSSKTGTITVTVPAYTHTLHFHAVTWEKKTMTMSITSEDVTNISSPTLAIAADGGAKASGTYTLTGNPVDEYYAITFTPVATEAQIVFTYSSGEDKRIIMYGINQEGGVLPVLDRIEITGTATALEYEIGDVFSPVGLGVNAIYTLNDVEQAPVALDVDENWEGWSFDPAYIAGETTSVTVTATYNEKSANKTVTGITVNVPSPEILVNPASVAFGNVNQDDVVEAEVINVTLKSVENATIALTGDVDAFTLDKTALTANGTISVTPVTSVAGTFAATITISDDASAAESKEVALSMTVKAPEIPDVCDGTDDFETDETADGGNYKDRSTTNGWTAVYTCRKTIDEHMYWTINGKTTTVGVITSPVLHDGIGSLKFRYANTFSESNGVSVKIEIKQGETVVKEYTLTKANSEVTQNTVYTEFIENINVAGDFQIIFTNLHPTNKSDGNKDRVSIGRLCWSNYSAAPEPVYEVGRGSLTEGNYYTICLPKKVTNFRGASIWNLEKRDNGGTEVYLEEAQLPFAAGTPFIIQATADKLEVVYEGDATSTPLENGALRGTLTGLDVDAFAALVGNIYILKENEIRPRTAGNWLSANRAYIDYDELVPVSVAPTSMPGKKVKRMPMQGQTTTDCELINAAEAPVKMMINGQLFILRGEKMYDTTGRLVK